MLKKTVLVIRITNKQTVRCLLPDISQFGMGKSQDTYKTLVNIIDIPGVHGTQSSIADVPF